MTFALPANPQAFFASTARIRSRRLKKKRKNFRGSIIEWEEIAWKLCFFFFFDIGGIEITEFRPFSPFESLNRVMRKIHESPFLIFFDQVKFASVSISHRYAGILSVKIDVFSSLGIYLRT